MDFLATRGTRYVAELATPDGARLTQGRVVVAHLPTTRIARPLLAAAATDLVGALVDVAELCLVVLQLVYFVYETSGDINGECSVTDTVV